MVNQNKQDVSNEPDHFEVESLFKIHKGESHQSPFLDTLLDEHFVCGKTERIAQEVTSKKAHHNEKNSFERAGPRAQLFWHAPSIRIAIVTCGGLAPGLNNVIQNLVTFLSDRYHVHQIYGVPYGLRGFQHDTQSKKFTFEWRELNTDNVQNIDTEGGSILGCGRGHSNPATVVEALEIQKIDILFMLGGDGTLTAGYKIYNEITKRKLKTAIIGIPKTVDNDIPWVSKTFGFGTAVSKAVEALRCAQTEARGAYNGIGLVRLMGRNSGAITATAALAMNAIDFVLIPEVKLHLEGEKGFLNVLAKCLQKKGHVTIALAEGCGQDLFPPSPSEYDASGNKKLKDIGQLLRQKIEADFTDRKIPFTLKYINPSYILRAQTTTAEDSIFCANLSQNAVHAAMSGKTGCFIGYTHECFTHVPLHTILKRKRLSTNDPLWLSVLTATGQPPDWKS